jgi:Ser/Thr protein kinase RdoA (MazF antagonist)
VTGAGGRVSFVLLSLLAGCVTRGAPSAREVLRESLIAHHQAELARDPEAVAEKLRRMAKGNFSFFRGAGELYPSPPSAFSAEVALIGDPHPENVGTFPIGDDEDDAIVDFNDFDQAHFGPFVDDLRRLALGLYIAADVADVARKHRVRLVDTLVDGYVVELGRLGRGESGVALRAGSAFGGDLAALLEPEVADGGLPPPGPGELDAGERQALTAALVGARATLVAPLPGSYFSVKRALRTRGGIASFFRERIRCVIEGPTARSADDVLVELKETPAESAALIVRLQRELQERPDQDPLLGHVSFSGRAYRLRAVGPRLRSISVERLAAEVKGPRWKKKDLRAFGADLGRLLARGHAHAEGPDGKPALARLAQVVGDGQTLARETVAVTTAAAARLEADVDHLRALLAERGPLLGWQTPPAK